ncbi:MAG: molybdopterin-dependent oxidoreductase [Acidimicrobiia bacterium]
MTDDPPNAATPLALLDGRDLEPGSIYQRNNFSLPNSAPDEVEVRTGSRGFSLNLTELGRLPRVEISMVLECAGNGRALMDPTPEGIPWGLGAVSPVRFSGARLLDAVGTLPETTAELVFTGSDRGVVEPEGRVNYQFSLTPDLWERAILATHLQGDPLHYDHGGPIRLVVPGQYAMKSVKWLRAIDAVDAPFTGHFVDKYRYFGDADAPEGAPVGDIQVRSLIATPAEGANLAAGVVDVRGMAWSANSIRSVEVSTDDGESWAPATVQPSESEFGPVMWQTEVGLEPGIYVIAARATDSDGAVQPGKSRWNGNGYANNVIHRVSVTVS